MMIKGNPPHGKVCSDVLGSLHNGEGKVDRGTEMPWFMSPGWVIMRSKKKVHVWASMKEWRVWTYLSRVWASIHCRGPDVAPFLEETRRPICSTFITEFLPSSLHCLNNFSLSLPLCPSEQGPMCSTWSVTKGSYQIHWSYHDDLSHHHQEGATWWKGEMVFWKLCRDASWQTAPCEAGILSSCCSVAQLCLTLCNPMDCSMPGFPALHYLLEFEQTHVHWVGDVIQPTHPLSSPSPLASCLSQLQGLFQWVGSDDHLMCICLAGGGKCLRLSTNICTDRGIARMQGRHL